jgi:hypothetical protein
MGLGILVDADRAAARVDGNLFRRGLRRHVSRSRALARATPDGCCTNIIGCTIFAAVSGSSAATRNVGKMTLPELNAGLSQGDDRHAAGAGTLGLLIPPSIIMIVYGVAPTCRLRNCPLPGDPGVMPPRSSPATSSSGHCFMRARSPPPSEQAAQKLASHEIPVRC